MSTILEMPEGLFDELRNHLLPPDGTHEEAAFLFAKTTLVDSRARFEVTETEKLSPRDFDSRHDDYLELKDETRARIIKRAHDLGASLVEMHSHPFPLPAAFSVSDRLGLKETVPHMRWRLKNRPYLAIVVAPKDFDALVWQHDSGFPQQLDCILEGNRVLRPTNISIGAWK